MQLHGKTNDDGDRMKLQGQMSYRGGSLAEDLEAVQLSLLQIRTDISELHVAISQQMQMTQMPGESSSSNTLKFPAAASRELADTHKARAVKESVVSPFGQGILLEHVNFRQMVREELKDIARGRLHNTKCPPGSHVSACHKQQQLEVKDGNTSALAQSTYDNEQSASSTTIRDQMEFRNGLHDLNHTSYQGHASPLFRRAKHSTNIRGFQPQLKSTQCLAGPGT